MSEILDRSRIGSNKPLILFLQDSNAESDHLRLCFAKELDEHDSTLSPDEMVNPDLHCESTDEYFAMITIARSFALHYADGNVFRICYHEGENTRLKEINISIHRTAQG